MLGQQKHLSGLNGSLPELPRKDPAKAAAPVKRTCLFSAIQSDIQMGLSHRAGIHRSLETKPAPVRAGGGLFYADGGIDGGEVAARLVARFS